MIWLILKWIGGIILGLWLIGYFKGLFFAMLYAHNKNYRNFVDNETYQMRIKEECEKKSAEEASKQERLGMMISQWTQTAGIYYHYYEQGVMMPDYAYMLDLLTQQIISMLGGDYKKYRQEIEEILKSKEVKDGRKKELTDKGIPPFPKDIKPTDFEKRNYTNDDIDKLLDEWQKKFGKKPEDKKDEQP